MLSDNQSAGTRCGRGRRLEQREQRGDFQIMSSRAGEQREQRGVNILMIYHLMLVLTREREQRKVRIRLTFATTFAPSF